MPRQERCTLMPLLFSSRSLSPVFLVVEVKGVRCPVSLLFLLSGSMHTTGSLSHRTQAPMMPPCFFFAPCPPQSQLPILECYLSHDYTWDPLASVPFLSLDQLLTPALYPLSFVLCPRINSELPAEQKRELRQLWKKKIDQGPGELKKKKKMSLNVYYATISIPLTHFFWRRHSSAHRSGYSCLETIAGVLLRQLLSYCKADAFFSRQSI